MKLLSSYHNYEYQIDIVTHKKKEGIKYAFYFLDGQNAFKDKFATYHKSLRAKKIINLLNKPYLAVAIYSPKNDDRYSMYTPFPLDFVNNDTTFCKAFIKDFKDKIIPTCEKDFKIKKRYLITSSLATIPALLVNELFCSIAFFSNAFFLNYEEVLKLIRPNKDTFNFICVGGNESSDGKYNQKEYLEASQWYYYLCKERKMPAKLYVDLLGEHSEVSWRKYLKLFIKQIKKDEK